MPNVSTGPILRKDITLTTDDGVELPATLFGGNGERSGPAVLISSAAAVERRFYRAFAEHLVDRGARAVLTYDYRGIGSAAPHAGAGSFRMKQWGTLDFPAALAGLEDMAGPGRIVGLGHSFGGLAIGLCGCSSRLERHAMIASLNGYYRRMREPLRVFFRMNLIGVPLTYLFGHLPASRGLGAAIAGPIFRDWARWCRHEPFLFDDPDVQESSRFVDVRLPLLSVGIDDDPWGTPAAVTALLDRFTNADLHDLWLSARDAGRVVGHNGFFRREMRETLWPPVTDFLVDGRWPQRAPAASK